MYVRYRMYQRKIYHNKDKFAKVLTFLCQKDRICFRSRIRTERFLRVCILPGQNVPDPILNSSVGDPDLQDPHVFGSPGSVSISDMY
jgi:hypothetical protein